MKKQIEVSIQATYRTLGELTPRTKRVWVVCHGYGQLAEYFIKNFECLDLEENYIIAPQGMSKFYLNGLSGRVGATWMTTEDRALEIGNYVNMLSSVYAEEMQGKSIDTVLFGFSQGASTISRWAVLSGVPFSALVLWGGQFPPDVDHAKAVARINDKPFMMYLGTQDQYITETQLGTHLTALRQQGLHPEVSMYEGEHKLYEAQLLQIEAKLNALYEGN